MLKIISYIHKIHNSLDIIFFFFFSIYLINLKEITPFHLHLLNPLHKTTTQQPRRRTFACESGP